MHMGPRFLVTGAGRSGTHAATAMLARAGERNATADQALLQAVFVRYPTHRQALLDDALSLGAPLGWRHPQGGASALYVAC